MSKRKRKLGKGISVGDYVWNCEGRPSRETNLHLILNDLVKQRKEKTRSCRPRFYTTKQNEVSDFKNKRK